MHTRIIYRFIILAFVALLSACSGYEKVLKSNDVNYKLKKANEYYEKKQYAKANELYESLIPIMKNTKNYEPLFYRYAWTFYNMKDYISASYYFKNFVDFFPKSKDAEEMQYMHALSLYKMSPKPSLDPTNTIKAMEAMQNFIADYPNSKRVSEAATYVDLARNKLEIKDAAAAELYFDIGHFKAASVAYASIMQKYPSSEMTDFYQYMIVRSWYKYARESIKERQEERYANAVSAYKELLESYPKSRYLQDAEEFSSLATKEINKLRSNEHQ